VRVPRIGRHVVLLTFVALTMLGVPAGLAAAPGQLDSSFGESGEFVFQANFGCRPGCVEFGGSYAQALAIEPGGKIVLAGRNEYIGARRVPAGRPTPESVLVRANQNGTLDSSFGDEGIAEAPLLNVFHAYTTATGGPLAIGQGQRGVGLARYTPTGEPDTAFGTDGVRWYYGTKTASDAALDTTGRVVVLGVGILGGPIEVVRFLPLGDRDPTFGADGRASLPMAELADPSSLAIEKNGAVLVLGTVHQSGTTQGAKRFLVRLTSKGRPDSTFGAGHRGAVQLLHGGSTVAIAPNGDILVAGSEHVEGQPSLDRLLLQRYTPTGRLDRSFGHNGFAVTTTSEARSRGAFGPSAIAFDGDGDPIVVGSNLIMTIDTGSAGSWFLAMYTQHGRDCDFGTGGLVFGTARGGASAVAVQPDGGIVIVGDRGHAFMAARYLGHGPSRTCPHEGERRRTRHAKRRTDQ
jgi:uncharacterized delta-60 repeat protein